MRHLMFHVQGLLLMSIGWYMPVAAFVLVGFMRTISPRLDESARMDGAGDIRIFIPIIVFFLFMHCRIISGLTTGALKG